MTKALDPIAVTEILRKHLPDSIAMRVAVLGQDIKLTRGHDSKICVCPPTEIAD
jgi:hypothetical protein